MSDSAVSSSAKGAVYLILQRIASRGLTFVLNQVLLRFLSPALLGASVQLELYIISAHHFTRESLRVACERRPDGGIQAAINISYMAIAGGLIIVPAFASWYLSTTYPDVPYFVEALRICEFAAVIELLSEPAYVAVLQKMQFGTRAAAEAAAVILKTLVTAGIVFWSHYADLELGVLPFAAGELVYCSSLTAVYLSQMAWAATKDGFSLFPRTIKSKESNFIFNLFSTSLLNLSISLYIQSGIKYVLTQGDVLVSTAFASLEDQGMYALAANYGGLIARMIFRPIEDSLRSLFAKLCASEPSRAQASRAESRDATEKKSKSDRPDESIKQAATTLNLVLRAYSIVSLIAFAVGPTAAPILLRVVAGSKWCETGAGEVLGAYCYCIPLLAINGVSEAFVAATATTKELHWQSIWMGAFSAGFAGSAYIFLRVLGLGAKGLVWANCVNMALRIVFNLYFVQHFFRQRAVDFKIVDLLPNVYAMGAAIVVPSVLTQTGGVLARYGLLGQLFRVGGIGGVFAVFVAITERNFLKACWRKARA